MPNATGKRRPASTDNEDKVPIVGNQDLPIRAQISGDLLTAGDLPGVIARALDFHDPTRWQLRMQVGFARARQLVGREETTIRNTGALVLRIDDAAHAWLEGPTNVIEQIGQCPIERGLRHMGARRANGTQFA